MDQAQAAAMAAQQQQQQQQNQALAWAQLQVGVHGCLSRWSAFKMALEGGWGGRTSLDKAQTLQDTIMEWFSHGELFEQKRGAAAAGERDGGNATHCWTDRSS
jgi:hypothetical protein